MFEEIRRSCRTRAKLFFWLWRAPGVAASKAVAFGSADYATLAWTAEQLGAEQQEVEVATLKAEVLEPRTRALSSTSAALLIGFANPFRGRFRRSPGRR